MLDKFGLTEFLGGKNISKKIDFIPKFKNQSELQFFIAKINRLQKDPVQVDLYLKAHGLEQVEGLKNYILNNNIRPESINELIQVQNYKNIADQAKGFSGVNAAIREYNDLNDTASRSRLAETIKSTNSSFGKYLISLNGADAGIINYGISLASTTVKTLALQTATIALNAAVSLGASVIITGVITAISSWINRTEMMAEKADEARSNIRSLNQELKEHQKFISDSAERYAKLAQGVDQLTGTNSGLSNEDYAEFLDLSNQIAEMFPTLPRIYRENGDAIIQLSGDVDTIVGSLQNLIEAERNLTNRQIAEELPTIFDDAVKKSDSYESELKKLKNKRNALMQGLADFTLEGFSQKIHNGLNDKYLEITSNDPEEYCQLVEDYTKLLEEADLKFLLDNLPPIWNGEYDKDGNQILTYKASISIESSDEDVEKAKNTIDGKIKYLADIYEQNINDLNYEIDTVTAKNKANWSSLNSSIFAWLITDDSFKVMNDEIQAVMQNIVNSLDWSNLNFSSWKDAKQYIQDNILSLYNTSDGKKALADIQTMLGIQTKFNNGDINVKAYQRELHKFLSDIENLPPESKKSIMLLFGIQTNEDGTISSDIDTMVNNVKGKLEDKFDNRVDKLNLKDLKIAYDLEVSDDDLLSWDELIAKIEEIKKMQQEDTIFSDIFSFTDTEGTTTALAKISDSIDTIQNAYRTLNETIKEYNENGFLSIDAVQSITELGSGYLDYLIDEEGNLRLDQEALQELTAARLQDMKAQMQQALLSQIESIKSETDANNFAAQSYREKAESIDMVTAATLKNKISNLDISDDEKDKVLNAAAKTLSQINVLFDNAIAGVYANPSKAIGSFSSSTSSALTDYKSMLDKELDALEKQLDAGRIEFKAYINKRKALIKDYYQYGRISASEYYSELEGTYQSQLDYYDKAISAVENLLNKEIDRIEKANEGLEKQLGNYDSILSAVSSVYDSEIDSIRREQDAIQDTIDALQDENDEREKALKLEQAEYDLHRARTQRTERVYAGEGLGVIYRTDRTAIHEAQENLADLALEQTISGLEEEKDALSSTIEELEIYRDLWAEIPDSKQTEEDRLLAAALWGGEYESFILNSGTADIEAFKNSYTAIQDMIDDNELLIESYKEKLKYWQDISDAHDIQTGNGIAADLFGENWQAEVLSGAIDACNDFKNEYIAIQQAMTDAAWASAVKIVPYASGTTHAGKGLNLVGEKGTETFIDNDGNVSLVTRPSLIPMEGGETVRNARETRSLLDPDNLVPAGSLPADTPASADILSFTGIDFNTVRLDTDEIRQRLQSIMPDYPDMIQADIHLHQYDFSNTRSNTTPVVQNITLTLPNVTNDSGYERIRNELKQMQLDALQFAHRR